VILDNSDSDNAGAGNEAEGASGDVDTRCIKQDASLYDTFTISGLTSKPHGMPPASA
jgi:hypothetical protein